MTPKLSSIEGILWDLDGTLYRYDRLFIEACNRASARTAIDLGLSLSIDEATEMARKSFEETGSSSFYFCRDHGINYRDFHEPYHANVDISIIAKNAEMVSALESLDLPMVILTNASRIWVKRILAHTGMNHLFEDSRIIALEDVGYQAKASSREGFEKGLAILNRPAGKTLMVEDLPRNLPKAKELGMVTALVHHGKIPEEHTAHIDYSFQTTLELVETLK